MHSVPGGPFSRERALPPEIEANLARKYNLDEPVTMQFVRYLGRAIRGDLGPSFLHEGRTTNQIIAEGFPKSAVLGVCGFFIALAIGVPMGIAAALRRQRLLDRSLMLLSVLGVSVPSFILASLLQYLFSYKFQVAPAAGWGESPWQSFSLPLRFAAFRCVYFATHAHQHAQRSGCGLAAYGPVRGSAAHAPFSHMHFVTRSAGSHLLGAVVGLAAHREFCCREHLRYPRPRKSFVLSIQDRDYTVIMGVTLFYSALLIGFNLLVDVLYALLDPRITLSGNAA